MVKTKKKATQAQGGKKSARNEVEAETAKMAVVANVNISPNTCSKTKKTAASTTPKPVPSMSQAGKKRKSTGKIVFDEIDQPKRVKSTVPRQKKGRSRSQTPIGGNHEVVDPRFEENNDQMIEMVVQANDDNMFHTESSEEESSENDSEISNDEVELRTPTCKEKSSSDNESVLSTQQRIQEIDEEMAQKLQELGDMMKKGGLTESMKVLDNL